MALTITLSEEAEAHAGAMVAEGRFKSMEQAIEAGLYSLRVGYIDEPVDLDDLSPADRAAVEEGLADIDAGRVLTSEEVFGPLLARLTAMAEAAERR